MALEVPGVQWDLHLPQERVAAKAIVVPHRELQRPRKQERLVNLILGREGKTTGEQAAEGRGNTISLAYTTSYSSWE